MNLRLGASPTLQYGAPPRVDLLPPELAANAKFRSTRAKLIALVCVSLVIAGAAYGAAQLRVMNANADLAVAQSQTNALLAEQATYADAVAITALVDTAEDARELGTSTEIMWDELLDAVQSYLPEGATIDSGTLMSRAPWDPELVPGGPLRETRVGTLQLVIRSPSVLDATDIVRRLSAIEGYADATPDLVTVEEGVVLTTITLNVGEDALSGRFAPETPTVEGEE